MQVGFESNTVIIITRKDKHNCCPISVGSSCYNTLCAEINERMLFVSVCWRCYLSLFTEALIRILGWSNLCFQTCWSDEKDHWDCGRRGRRARSAHVSFHGNKLFHVHIYMQYTTIMFHVLRCCRAKDALFLYSMFVKQDVSRSIKSLKLYFKCYKY